MLTISLLFLFSFLLIFFYFLFKKAKNNRNWSDDQIILAYADIKNNNVFIHNVRNFNYFSEFEYQKRYYNKNFDLNKIKKVYYVLVPFSSVKGIAHTFLSFEFVNNDFISISIEIRKKEKDKYSPFKGLLKFYEIMYVVGSEYDLIKQRSDYRKNKVYLYPLKLEKKQIKKLFLDIIKKINQLKEKPEFYNTATNACTINIIKHLNNILSKKIHLSWHIFFPEFSDKLFYKLKLIDTNLSFEKTKEKFLINNKTKNTNENNFSKKIRLP